MSSTSIEAIQERYRRSLANKATELAIYLDALSEYQVTEQAIKNAEAFLHKLAGSSGMYGYDAICERSRLALGLLQQGRLPEAISVMRELTELLERSA